MWILREAVEVIQPSLLHRNCQKENEGGNMDVVGRYERP